MSLPPVAALVTAEAVAALPARLRGRLDAAVEQAHTWPAKTGANTVTVHPDDRTTVTLTLPVTTSDDAVCDCLLSPRCLHRAAVLSAAPILTTPQEGTAGDVPPLATPGQTGEAASTVVPSGGASAPLSPSGSAVVRSDGVPASVSAVVPSGGASAPLSPSGSAVVPSGGVPVPLSPSGSAVVPSAGAPLPVSPSVSGQSASPQSGDGDVAAVPADPGASSPPASESPDRVAISSAGGARSPSVAERQKAVRVSEAQRRAAAGLWTAAAGLVAGGVPAAGAVAQAELLRAVHQARATGLQAAPAAAVRVVEHLRAARRDDPAFRRAELTADLRELLVGCHRLASGDVSAIGVARRDYQPVGDLRLFGLFCEPVRAATGHAGAVTYLADPRGRAWVVSDVKPADPAVALTATRASVDLGEVRLSHHDLSRGGLRAINAHASAAGRLSHGRARQAVAAPGAGWFDEPLAALWRAEPAAQVDRWLAATALPAHERPAAHDLAYLDGTILGSDRRGLLLAVGVRPAGAPPPTAAAEGDGHAGLDAATGGSHRLTVAVAAPHEDPALPYVGNLRMLAAHAAGRPLRIIGRFTGAGRIDGLAFAAHWLPARFGGHVDLGAQRLNRADLLGVAGSAAEAGAGAGSAAGAGAGGGSAAGAGAGGGSAAGAAAVDRTAGRMPPLDLVRHHLERVAASGRAALLSGVDDDARRLAAAHLGTAAAVVAALGAAGVRRTRDVFGRLDPHDAENLALAWLTAAVYEKAASDEATRTAWSAPSG